MALWGGHAHSAGPNLLASIFHPFFGFVFGMPFFRPFFRASFFSEKNGLNFEILAQKNEIRLDLGAEKLFSAVFRSIPALIGFK